MAMRVLFGLITAILTAVLIALGDYFLFIEGLGNNPTSVPMLITGTVFLYLSLASFFAFVKIISWIKKDTRALLPFNPQTFQGERPTFDLASALTRTLNGTPYHVLANPNTVRVQWNAEAPNSRALVEEFDIRYAREHTFYRRGRKFRREEEEMRWNPSTERFEIAGEEFTYNSIKHANASRPKDAGINSQRQQLITFLYSSNSLSKAIKDALKESRTRLVFNSIAIVSLCIVLYIALHLVFVVGLVGIM